MQEKRSCQRTCISIPIRCLCRFREDENLSLAFDGVTADMSDAGISFYTGKSLADCSKIEIRGAGWNGPKKGKIMWQKVAPDMGIFRVGVSLQHEDPNYAGRTEPLRTF
ncbi:MAG: hypothetical protein M0Z58_03010 [Nitrospiraceae bacterium]|nr:hypothetical protein [Nitrospiraceae bacterium]